MVVGAIQLYLLLLKKNIASTAGVPNFISLRITSNFQITLAYHYHYIVVAYRLEGCRHSRKGGPVAFPRTTFLKISSDSDLRLAKLKLSADVQDIGSFLSNLL